MRIVSLEEFVKLPVGTIFSEYEPFVLHGLSRKMETLEGNEIDGPACDFFYQSLLAECRNCEQPTVDTAPSRWGMFDFNAQFAIYEPADIQLIKEQLS